MQMQESKNSATSPDKKKRILSESRPFYQTALLEEGLACEPANITFDSVTPGTLYVMTFSVRNTSKVGQRIRLQHESKTGYFVLNYIPSGTVAPGLDIRGEIECRIPVNTTEYTFSDRIVATMGNQQLVIPLFASKPYAKIKFNPLLEFGGVVHGHAFHKEISFENVSDVRGTVRFSLPSDSFVKIHPMKFDLDPQGFEDSQKVVKFTVEGKDIGFFREIVKVHIAGALEDSIMDITAQVIEQKLTLIHENNGGLLEVANFGNMFFGEVKTINALLVNTGPNPLNYLMCYDDEEPGAVGGSSDDPSSAEDLLYSKSLEITPPDGNIKGFSQANITITFRPVKIMAEKGFMKQHNEDHKDTRKIERKVYIECREMNQRMLLTMQGAALAPSVVFSPSTLRFGECPVNDRRDIIMTLQNRTKFPTKFEFPIVATFKFNPTKGLIQGNETLTVVATFLPPQLGEFRTVVKLQIAGGLQVMEVRALGDSTKSGLKKLLVTGADKLPADFVIAHKYVNPEEEAAARAEKKKSLEVKEWAKEALLRKSLDTSLGLQQSQQPQDLLKTAGTTGGPDPQSEDVVSHASSHERDLIYGFDTASRASSKVHHMDKTHPTATRRLNEQVYNEYLQASHAQRSEAKRVALAKRLMGRGAINKDDPFSVNMGMERGLEEPELKIPHAGEPLWLANSKDGEGAGGTSRLPTDENRLIVKKWSSTPATQAELRDCTGELTLDELKIVTASHTLIDFGRVSVGSLSGKNFVVANDLKRCICVTVEDLDPELAKSKALCQVIPQGAVAGFDIFFSCRQIGKFRKSFTWKINGIHSSKVFVVADVVPIEVVMSTQQVTMEFAPDSLQPTLTEEIALTNPGNASADFLWGSAGAFVCNPDKGSINPGKSQVISISWNPLSGKRNEEELGLHITGGVDQTLKVVGVLKETKAEFSDKRIMLSVLAVGTEKVVTTSIKNVGVNPLAFFFNHVDEKYGITISPEVGLVPAGESLPITVTITPRSAMNYDNTSLSAKIRGGKQITLKLAGSSTVPQLSLEQSGFSFGTVIVGAEHSLPMTITNRSAIVATLILDLNLYPDFIPRIRDSIEEQSFGAAPTASAEQEDSQGNQITLEGRKDGSNNQEEEGSARRGKKAPVSNLWKVILMPNCTVSADLVFKPLSPKQFGFRLHLYLQGISEDKSLSRDVSGTSLASVLGVSEMTINFGDRIVSRDPMSRMSYFLETTLKNLSSKGGLSYEIREMAEITKEFGKEEVVSKPPGPSSLDDASSQIFFISPTKGDLGPNLSSSIRVTFQPQSSGDYSKKLEVYIKGQPDTSRPYLVLNCVGSGVFPRLTFSKQHLELPSVPLSVTSRAQFVIFNNGYNSLDINHRISPNIPVPLEITYPDGNNIGIMIDKIRVQVAVKSDTPVSWMGKIEFYDQDGERFFVSVSGCSDGCLLTNYPFVRDYSQDYGFVGIDDQPVKFLRKTEIAEMRAAETKRKEELRRQRSLERQRAVEGKTGAPEPPPSPKKGDSSSVQSKKSRRSSSLMEGSTSSGSNAGPEAALEGIDLDKEEARATSEWDESESLFLLKWLNKNICRRPLDIERFPLCMLDQGGDLAVDCIEQMSGKKVFGKEETSAFPSKRNSDVALAVEDSNKRNSEKNQKVTAANKLVFKFQQILNMLINNGALLAHVNPICMLSLEDHLLAQEYELTRDKSLRFTPAMLADRRKSWEGSWSRLCRQSWLELLYQSVKVYVLNRLTYQTFTKMPGVILSDGKDLAPPAPAKKAPAAPGPPAAAPKAKKTPAYPKDFQPSNVFSHSEAVLLAWATYHLDHAGNMIDEGAAAGQMDSKLINFNKRVFDLNSDFGDVFGFCQLIHSHVTDITAENEPLSGYTTIDRSQRDDLTSALQDAMAYLKMELGLSVQDLVSSTRNILLMLLHLFLNLPSLIPKTKIEFTGELGSPIVKTIELKNPSSKKIVYQITLRGSSDFSIDSSELVIPPESTVEYAVNLNARFFEPVLAKLTFWGVKDSGQAGSTMCFQLISSITGRRPFEKISRKSNLFELETFALQIRNPFGKDGTYSVRLQVQHIPVSVEDYVKGNSSTKGMKPPALRERISADTHLNDAERKLYEQDLEIEGAFTCPFWTNEESVVLTKTGTKSLYVYMLPFMIGKYTCQVVFVEKDTGEFCYQLSSEVGLPKAYDRLEFSSLQGQGTNVAVRVAAKNTGFEKAFTILTEARIKAPAKKIKARTLFQNIFSSPVVNEDTGQCNYFIDFLHPYFSVQRRLALVSEYLKMKTNPNAVMLVKEIKSGSTAVQKNFKKVLKTLIEPPTAEELAVQGGAVLNSAILSFTAPKAGVYQNTAIVFGKDNPYDIRVIDITATAGVPDSKMTLEFRGAARQRVVQDIPVTNESAKDWTLAVTCTGRGFSAPKLLTVPRGNTPTLLEVVFQASFAGNFEGHLVLKNPENNDTFQYTLIGVADDPLADDSLHFSCAARKRKACSIQLNQIATPPPVSLKGSTIAPRKEYQTFEVETDLPYVTSAATVDVPAEGKKFDFFVQSPMGGTFQGSMTFRDVESGAIVWYTVTIEVTSPSEERSIDVEAVVRKAVVVDITLSNPSDEPLLFDVYFQGEGLIGDSMFELAPRNTAGSNDTYELIYSPLLTGSFVGRISFTNDRVGELWYKLNLTALPAPPIVCDPIESMVGTSQSVTVPLDNPLAEAVVFNVEIEDPEHFFLSSDKVSLGPYAQSSFAINFRPDSLNETVHSTVRLYNEKFGEIVYLVSGTGLLPGNMAPVAIETPLGELGSESIQFRNPFSHPLPMDVVLSISDPSSGAKQGNGKKGASAAAAAAVEPVKPAFALLLKRTTDLVVPPKTLFQIAVSFNPLTLGAYEATLQIRSTVNGRSLLWCYPIVGIAEAGTALRLPLIKTPCKTSLMKEIEIPLEGIRKSDVPSVEDFSMSDISIETKIDDKMKGMVARAFRVQAVEAVVMPEDEPNTFYMKGKSRIDYALKCRLLFEPLRTFQTRIEVVIVYRNRGKWRVIVDLEAADPEPDDRIKLVAPVGGQDKVSFKLNNRFLGFSNFQAYFSAKSSPHFHVTPTSGVLAPYGAEGSQFMVQFAPVEYGIIEVGTLVIQTEDTQWNYEVRGSYPDATINTAAIRSKVDCFRGGNTNGGLTISVPK